MIANAGEQPAIPVAIALPLSGPRASLGLEIRAAVELAVGDAGAAGDRTAKALDLRWVDDRCSSDGGAAAAAAITADPGALPVAVIGHACPSAALAAGALYDHARVVNLTAGALPAREPQTRRFGPLHVRLPADRAQGALIGAALVDAGPDARIAFVRDRTQFAQTTLQPVAVVLAAHGRSIAALETFAGAEKDFTALAQRLAAARITHIALAAFASEAVLLVEAVRAAIPDVVILATDQLADPLFGRLAGPAAEGVLVALAPDATAYPAADRVVAALAARGVSASRSALASYAALQVLIAAATLPPVPEAEGVDPQSPSASTVKGPAPVPKAITGSTALGIALATQTFATILGPVRFGSDGAADLPSHVWYVWHGGALQIRR